MTSDEKFVLALLVTFGPFVLKEIWDAIKARLRGASAVEQKQVDANTETLNALAKSHLELSHLVKEFGTSHSQLKEHATEGLKAQRKELEELKTWKAETATELRRVFKDLDARTVVFTSNAEATAAKRKTK